MRDRLKKMRSDGAALTLLEAINPFSDEQAEAVVALSLGRLQSAGRDRQKLAQLMEENWEQIYELSNRWRRG